MTLGEYRSAHEVLRYASTVDQFRQISQVAAAQGICVINAGYEYISELLERYPVVFDRGRVEELEARDVIQMFDEPSEDEAQQAEEFLREADAVLRPFQCYAQLKKFSPMELPTLYTITTEGQFFRSIEQSKEIANPLWSSVLDNLAPTVAKSGPFSQLSFNFENNIVRRLIAVKSLSVLKRSIQILYMQALLLGHHPLNAKEMKLLNTGLVDLIDLALDASEKER